MSAQSRKQSSSRQPRLSRRTHRRTFALAVAVSVGMALGASNFGSARTASASSDWGAPSVQHAFHALPHQPRVFANGPHHVFTVNSQADEDNTTASNTADVCKAANGACTLRAAVEAANHDTKPDKIVIPAGTYELSSLGTIIVEAPMLIVGAGGNKTFIDGAHAYGIFGIEGGAMPAVHRDVAFPTVEIDDVTLRNGHAQDGGAVATQSAQLILSSDILTANVAAQYGGAVACDNGDLWINNTVATRNSASIGGAVEVTGTDAEFSNDTIGGTKAADGNHSNGFGGGIILGASTASLENTMVEFNMSHEGAGGVYSDGSISVQGGAITHNSVSLIGSANDQAIAGGLYLDGASQLDGVHIDDNSIRSDEMGSVAAGIFNTGYAKFVDSTADGNVIADQATGNVDQGAGIDNIGTMLWSGGTISGNKIVPSGKSAGLTAQGVGVYDVAPMSISGAAISDNSSIGQTIKSGPTNEYQSSGGGVYDVGALHLSHDDLEGNSLANFGVSGVAIYSDGPTTTEATDLDIGKNEATAVSSVQGGAIDTTEPFALTNSTIHDQSNSVSGSVGEVDGGVALFTGVETSLDGVVIRGVTNTCGNGGRIMAGAIDVSASVHFDRVTMSNVTNTCLKSGQISDTINCEDPSVWHNVSISGITNVAGTKGGVSGVIQSPVIAVTTALMDNVTISNVHNSALGSGALIDSGVLYGIEIVGNDLKVTNVTNTASGSESNVDGGAIETHGYSTFVDLEMNHISNTAGTNGGVTGGALHLGGVTTIEDADISDIVSTALGTKSNSSKSNVLGGAVYSGMSLSLTNTTMTGDRAISPGKAPNGGYGGAVYQQMQGRDTNVTMNGDTASTGGGAIYEKNTVAWPIAIANSIITSDPSPTGNCGAVFPGATYFSAGHNLGSDASCSFTNVGDQTGKPKLGPLQNNGGFVLTEAELSRSSTINAGSNTICPTTDARGVVRPQGGTCDIGAYELKVSK